MNRARSYIVAGLVTGGSLSASISLVPGIVAGQQQTAASALVPAALATIATDTGDYAPGHRVFTRYQTPGLCASAAATTAEVIRNTLAGRMSYDSLRTMPARDTLPSAAVAVARACAAKFTLENTPATAWASLFDLALLARNDSLAQVVFSRRLATAASPAARDSLRRTTLQEYLGEYVPGLHHAEPARLHLAEGLVAQWDTVPDDDLRLFGHSELLRFAAESHDLSLAMREIRQISAIAHRVHPSTSLLDVSRYLQRAYMSLAQLSVFDAPDSVHRVAELAQEDLHNFASDTVCIGWMSNCRTATAAQVEARLVSAALENIGTHPFGHNSIGNAMPALKADYWFPSNGGVTGASPDRIGPVPGKITLFVYPEARCQMDVDYLLFFGVCYGVLESVRQWEQRYGSRGVSVVILAGETGSEFLGGVETPAQEAERIRWYFQDFGGVRAAVGVQRGEYRMLEDGRRLRQPPDVMHWGFDRLNSGIEVVDQNGNIALTSQLWIGSGAYPEVDRVINRLLRLHTKIQ